MLDITNLNKQQLTAIEFAKKKKKCALFLGLGFGKTVTSLTVADFFLKDFLVTNVLVVSTKRIVDNVWQQEAAKWKHLKHLKINICTGAPKKRIKQLNDHADIHLINRENVSWLVDNFLDCWRWDMLIIDESSSFKNHSSLRFKKIKKVIDKFASVSLLTGTPAPKGEHDLWSQTYLLDKGVRLGRNITIFRNKYFHKNYNGFGYEINKGSSEIIKSKIKDVCLTMDSPCEIETKYLIEFTEKDSSLMKTYDEFKKTLLLELDNKQIEAKTLAALTNKLLQFCNGYIYDEFKQGHYIHNKKIQVLKEILEDNPNENFLIAYNFKTDLESLKNNFPDAVCFDGKNDAEIIKKWNNKEIRLLLAHPASAGHGLNLQKGGHNIVWFGLNWSLELYLQFNGRLARQGQENSVNIIHILIPNTADEIVYKSLTAKNNNQQDILNYLKLKPAVTKDNHIL